AITHAILVLEQASGINAQKHVVSEVVFLLEIMRVARGHQRQAEVVSDCHGPFGAASLDIKAVVLYLDVKVSAEDFREPNCRFAGFVQLIEQDVIAELGGSTAGKTDDSLAVGFENLFIDARDVVITFEVGDRRHLDEVPEAGKVSR